MRRQDRTNEIREFIIDSIISGETKITGQVIKEFNISRQAVNRHILQLIADGVLMTEGATRNKKYLLKNIVSEEYEFDINDDFLKDKIHGSHDENKVWLKLIKPLLKDLSKNVMEICQYGFTEMLNNVFDHSDATKVKLLVKYNAAQLCLAIEDNGIGIFNKIQTAFGLEDQLHSILELTKGKLTTDPAHHTGEGIFFSSRMFDRFNIESGILRFIHIATDENWLIEEPEIDKKGTTIQMRIDPKSERTSQEIFEKFASELEDFGFTKTKVPVALAKYGDENLVSRSQAKRLLVRFDRFKEVILDFKNVDSIGPAFADEIFRVFVNEHPGTKLEYVNANEIVKKIIVRAQNYQ